MPKVKRKSFDESVTLANSFKPTDNEEAETKLKQSISIHEATGSQESTLNHDSTEGSPPKLTAAQRARIELNRQKALLIRQDKLNRKKIYNEKEETKTKVIRVDDKKLVDTGGGFFIEQADGLGADDLQGDVKIVSEPAPLLIDDQPFCEDCSIPFNNSYLQKHFEHSVCDKCRDSEEKHCLITKTDAKNNYLLTDADIDKRIPLLKFILRKNPHNERWGDMKLYLKLQVEKRALQIWETEEKLEKAIEEKEEKREIMKQKKYVKKMKELRMNVRSSLYTKTNHFHEHEYGQEEYLPESDEYKKTCSTCGHSYLYEKM